MTGEQRSLPENHMLIFTSHEISLPLESSLTPTVDLKSKITLINTCLRVKWDV